MYHQDSLSVYRTAVERGVEAKSLVPITPESLDIAKKVAGVIDIRHLDFEPIRFAVIDDEAYLVLYPHRSPISVPAKRDAYILLWTLSPDLVLELNNLFNKMWDVSKPFEERVSELRGEGTSS